MLKKFNRILNKISIPLNFLNIFVGLLFGIAHVYIPLTSLFGLILGVIMAFSGSITMGISYYFTAKSTESKNKNDKDKKLPEPPPRKHTAKSSLFLAAAIPMLLLNSAACFFGMYTGTILLVAALALPIAPAAVITVAIVLATILTVGTLINSWLQTNYIWERLKKPAPAPALNKQAVTIPKVKDQNKTRFHVFEPRVIKSPRPVAADQPRHVNLNSPAKTGHFFNKRSYNVEFKNNRITRATSAPTIIHHVRSISVI